MSYITTGAPVVLAGLAVALADAWASHIAGPASNSAAPGISVSGASAQGKQIARTGGKVISTGQ